MSCYFLQGGLYVLYHHERDEVVRGEHGPLVFESEAAARAYPVVGLGWEIGELDGLGGWCDSFQKERDLEYEEEASQLRATRTWKHYRAELSVAMADKYLSNLPYENGKFVMGTRDPRKVHAAIVKCSTLTPDQKQAMLKVLKKTVPEYDLEAA